PTSNVPLRAGKGWLYEGGIREPMIIKWPGVVKPGSTCQEVVTSTDFYPTMLEMAYLPLRPRQHCDGLSLLPLLKRTGKLKREAVYWHYPHYSNQGCTPGGAVRAGDWKLIEFYEDMRVELYNLADDISEKNDLAAKIPWKADELRRMLHAWRKEVGAVMPKPNPNYGKPKPRKPK
ncbi:MAG: sulfatase/phosphatase domain-containing protein, partial [Phycisphaerae bacterium]